MKLICLINDVLIYFGGVDNVNFLMKLDSDGGGRVILVKSIVNLLCNVYIMIFFWRYVMILMYFVLGCVCCFFFVIVGFDVFIVDLLYMCVDLWILIL